MTASALEFAGVVLACGAAAVAILAPDRRLRYAAIAIALLAAPALVAGDVWDQSRFVDLRDDPALLAGLLVAGGAALAALAALFQRVPAAFPVLAIAVLPFRVPIQIGGETSDLLVPLYGVIAAEAACRIYCVFRERSPAGGTAEGSPPRGTPVPQRRGVAAVTGPAGPAAIWLKRLLAATLVLYALQSAYSEDVSNAIENAAFFLVPFAVLLVLLLEVEWTPRLLGWVLVAISADALAFAAIGFWQHAERHLTFNKDLLAANQLHTYFRVNALFHDPNVLGRYLALTIIAIAAYVAWARDLRSALVATGVAGVSIAALGITFSLTSFAALIAGLLVLVWLRWGLRAGAAATVAVAVAGGAYILGHGVDSGGVDDVSEGRVDLVNGGIDLAVDRPVWGWGSGAFGAAFERHIRRAKTTTSHSEPITVAAEQGAPALAVYLALLAVALAVLLLGARAGPARAAVAACFAAMIVHSIGYAGFAIDPVTWALLALGLAVPVEDPTATPLG